VHGPVSRLVGLLKPRSVVLVELQRLIDRCPVSTELTPSTRYENNVIYCLSLSPIDREILTNELHSQSILNNFTVHAQ